MKAKPEHQGHTALELKVAEELFNVAQAALHKAGKSSRLWTWEEASDTNRFGMLAIARHLQAQINAEKGGAK